MTFFKKKTREEMMQQRTNFVLSQLLSTADFEFTDLETVQILNSVRLKLHENLNQKRSESLSKSTDLNQKAKELKNVLDLLE